MAYFVYDPRGKPVGLLAPGEDPSQLRANGYTVSEVSDADVTTDANGQVLVSMAALQQQQAFANSLQAAAALRAVEQNQINAYGAQTSRLGQIIPLVGQTQNYGLLANITAGDARAPYLSVPAGLSRMAGPSPIQSDYSQAKTYSAKDASDFARKATEEKTSAENQATGGQKPLTGTTQPPKAPAAQAATVGLSHVAGTAPGPLAASGGATAPTVAPVSVRTPVGGGAGQVYSVALGRWVSQIPGAQPVAPPAAGSAAVAATTPAQQNAAAYSDTYGSYNDALTGKVATVSGAAMHAQSGQSAWEARRDALLGGQRHDDFQMAHSTTAQELNDIAKIGDPNERLRAFNAIKARPAWTPETSHGSNWRASGDGGGNPYRHTAGADATTFDYNAAPTQTFQQPQQRGGNRSMALTSDQQHKLDQKAARDRAAGGTDVLGGTDMARPSMFGGPPMPSPSDPTSGFGFDPHAPTQTPDNLRQIAVILQSPPSPSPSALEAAVRECWTLDPRSGQPMYTGHYADNAAKGTQAVPNGGLLASLPGGSQVGDQETAGDVSTEGGSEPPPPLDMPAPGGKPAMFAEGGTSGTDRRVGPNATYDPRWGFLPKQPSGAADDGVATAPTVSYSGLPPAPQPPAAAAPVAASGGGGGTPARPRAPATRGGAPATRGGGPRAEQPSAPSADIMRKVTNYYLAQFGGTPEAATADLQSGSADATNWLKSALGMAMAGQLDQYDTAPAATTPPAADAAATSAEADKKRADAAKPAPAPAVQDTRNAGWRQKYMAQQAQGAQANYAAENPKPTDYAGAVAGGVGSGLRLSGGRVTTASTPTTPPHPDEVKAAIAGMTYTDAVNYINSLYGRAASAVSAAPRAAGGTDFVYYDDPTGGYDPGSGDWYTASGGPTETGRMTLPGAGGGVAVPINGPLHQPGVYNVDPRYTYDPAHRMARGGTDFVYYDDPYGPDMTDPLDDMGMYGPSTAEGGPWIDDVHSGGGSTVPVSNGSISHPILPPLGGMALNPNIRNAAGGTTVAPTVYYDDFGNPYTIGPRDPKWGGYTGREIGTPNMPYVVPIEPPNPRGLPAVGPIHPLQISRNAMGGTTFVARRPTMFNAGGRQFLVGEDTRHGHPSGADELVSISGGPGQTVVHVDPLQRRGTGIPPAVAATANLAVPGSPYRPKVGIPASAIGPGRADAYAYAHGGTASIPMDPSMGGGGPSMGDDPAAALPDVIPVGNGIVLVRQPDGSYLPMDAQQMQSMLGSLPAGGGGDNSSMGGDPMSAGAGPSPMAAGGTRVYGTVAPGATISRVGGQPSATGQIKVPGGRGGSTTQPFYAVQPFPNPEYALSRNVDQLTPDELQQVGLVTQNRAGYNVNQWAALQARGRLMSQAPAAIGAYSRPF